MTGFIEIKDNNNNFRLLNIRHIEEVVETSEDRCIIYLAFSCPNAIDQDYLRVNESYQSIKNKLKLATM